MCGRVYGIEKLGKTLDNDWGIEAEYNPIGVDRGS
jgi:hypothetical protein